MTKVHSSAVVHPGAHLEDGVEVGPYVVIEDDVTIGRGTVIGPHVVIARGTQVGQECQIFPFATIGTVPQSLRFQGEESRVVIGDHNIIREYVTIHRGTAFGGGRTTVGHHNFLMAYVHIAHDCHIHNHVIMANAATLAGHIEIEDYAVVGGLVAIHQFVRVGAYSLIGGASGIPQDVPPYVSAVGNRARLFGLNLVGLKRHNFSEETIRKLKRAYRVIFRSGLRLTDALAQVEEELGGTPEVDHMVEFIKKSERGILR